MPPETFLVALDGSPRAGEVLAYAVRLARQTGAKLTLLRSYGLPPVLPPHVWALPEASLADLLRKEAIDYVEKCMAEVPSELRGGTIAEFGTPWDAICRAARSVRADLVIIGSHGYSGLDHVLGTTAARVVNHVDRPLLVVRSKRAS